MVCYFIAMTYIVAVVSAHSWVERLMKIGLNGTMIGDPGFIRGTVSRLNPDFNDFQMQHLLSSLDGNICKDSQSTGNYTNEFPALLASPGDFITLQHQENGHVTLPQNSPEKTSSGTVYVYGTSLDLGNPKLSSIHGVWDNNGADEGRLLATCTFDDGQCYQINDGIISKTRQLQHPKMAKDPQGADLWCQCGLRLPHDLRGSYTLYWVWDWPSMPSESPVVELYTSCMDIQISGRDQFGNMQFIDGQDLNEAGVEEQLV